uniref:Putative methyltransferase n=1 Tax=viral metagenome TaxID=1070528 RepID=A0A6H1ZGJ9_9ZZZZ
MEELANNVSPDTKFEQIIAKLPKPYYRDNQSDIVIYHADCRSILPLIPEKSIDLVLTDPFYVPKKNFEWKLFDEFYWDFNKQWLIELRHCLKNEFHLFISFSQNDMARFDFTLRELGFNIKSRIVWNYRNSCKATAADTQFAKTYEFIFHCSSGKKLNFPEKWDDRRFDVKTFAIPQSNFSEGKLHQFQKPLKLWNEIIEFSSNGNELILDPFLGAGTTAYCAKKLNRKCIGIEIEECYCEIAANRLRQGVLI